MPESAMARNPEPFVVAGIDEHGHGIAEFSGRRLHVTDLLPGESAEITVLHDSPHGRDSWGQVTRRLGADSPDRVTPACPGFGRCGGCAWQHLGYPAQLREKRGRVVVALSGIVAPALIADAVGSPAVYGYRNKGKYVVGSDRGAIVLGSYAPRTHKLIESLGCQVVAPVIDEVATWLRGAADVAGVAPYDEARRTGALRYAIVRANHVGDVLVALVATSNGVASTSLRNLAEAVAKHPAVRGVVAVRNDRSDGAIVPHDATIQVLAGEDSIVELVSGVELHLGVREFLQVNRAQADAMYRRVAELAELRAGQRAIDLYAGVGGITFALAQAGANVTAIEIDRAAVTALVAAANHAGLTTVNAIAAEAASVASIVAGERPDVIVVNPPRKGLGATVAEMVATSGAATLIYVSCGPESLGRDLAIWQQHGYVVDVVQPFDLMPGTGQIETVVRARKSR